MSLPERAPSWLKTALSDEKYVITVYKTLMERDQTRQLAGSAALQSGASNEGDGKGSDTARKLSGWGSRLVGALKHNSSASNGTREDPDHAKLLEHYYRISVGSHPVHRPHNRYGNIIPYDRTRVRIAPTAVHGKRRSSEVAEARRDWAHETDYLNANWVRELWGGQWYVAAQAPLRETAHAFLSLFFSSDSRPPPDVAPELHGSNSNVNRDCRMRTAVQLTVAAEGGQTKAHPYFHASKIGVPFVVAPFPGSTAPPLEVRLESEERLTHACCIKSVLRIVPCRARIRRSVAGAGSGHGLRLHGRAAHAFDNEIERPEYEKEEEIGEPVYITHLLFTNWPDYGVPRGSDKAALVEFARIVARVNASPPPSPDVRPENNLTAPANGLPPITINCSAGIGRTGTFIALSSLLRNGGFLGTSPSPSATLPNLPQSPLGPLPDQMREDAIAQEVDMLREQRPMMVQSPAQLMLIYDLFAAVLIEAEIRREREPER